MSFSDTIGEKLVKADDIDIERFNAELTNIAEKAIEGDPDSQEVLSIIFDESWESIEHNLNQPFSEMHEWWMDGVHAFGEWKGTHASKNAATADELKLQEIEKKILQFCTKPRTSSYIIELFPARPYNILGIVENLKRRGLINLASNHYVTNVTNREFMPTMTMTASRKTSSDNYKRIASKWDTFTEDRKAEILDGTSIFPEFVEEYKIVSWKELPNWVRANVEHTLEMPEEHIELIALQDVDSGVILDSDEQILEGLSSGLEYYTAYTNEGKKANKEEWHWGILSELVGETVKVGQSLFTIKAEGVEEKKVEKEAREWLVHLDVKDIWESAEDMDLENEEEFLPIRDQLVEKLRTYADEIGSKIGQEQKEEYNSFLDNLQDAPDIEEFNYVWEDLYDWADTNSVWVGAAL